MAPRPVIERASGIYMWDREGRRYIDASSGPVASNLGHGNARVLEAMRRQAEEMFGPLMTLMPKVPAPLTFRVPEGQDAVGYAKICANALDEEIRRQGPETVLAFIMEPVGGLARGAAAAPDPYYGAVREICRRHGVLLIYDEVMSGAGRTGKFLAADHWPLEADLRGGLASPFAAADRIPSGVVLHQPLDRRGDLGRVFPTGLRPSPGRRIPSASTVPSSNSRLPLAMVNFHCCVSPMPPTNPQRFVGPERLRLCILSRNVPELSPATGQDPEPDREERTAPSTSEEDT
ncbi:MAG: hypothetical protein A3J75_06945 [Acidobacteria bacterium RBG_16_68_9]|nr:MAG: hypothetical protein A3J75_06945 [Acidobacteria bacterium RBG_16_68_9]